MKKVLRDYIKKAMIICTSFLLMMHGIIFSAYASESSDFENNGEYVEIDDELLDVAATVDDSFTYITDLSECYGDSITSIVNMNYDEIVRKIIGLQYGVNDLSEINLGNQIELYDANNVNTYMGYNFCVNNTNEHGYITIATHTKTTLVKEIVDNLLLPEEREKVYYLSNSEFYFWNELEQCFQTLDGLEISYEDFEMFLEERKQALYNLTIELLASTEVDSLSQINNLLNIDKEENNEIFMGYNGQSGSGYGGIEDCPAYLKDKYHKNVKLKSSKFLEMSRVRMIDLEKDKNGKSVNNCTLTAITRILDYYRGQGYKKINANINDIYATVRKSAVKNGYTPSKGTDFWKIDNIVEEVLHNYGYKKAKCKGIYLWSFREQIKKEIDANRPVIMNLARGFYGNHTVTVSGYAIYKSGIITYNMIQVYDGWKSVRRFIDYYAFAYDLITSGFGSFNTIRIK